MEPLNRLALLVTPKRRFIDWVNGLPDAGPPLKEEELASLRSVFLLAVGNLGADLQDLIDTYWADVFEEELSCWTTDESQWPPNRTPTTFRNWFHLETVDSVTDADPDEPFTLSEVARTRCAMCNSLLDEEQIAVVLRDEACERWTFAELDAWERERSMREEIADESITALFRCCGTECATRVEKAMTEETADGKVTH
jgi:hypothetical protein